MSRVLVFGGSGQLGCEIVKAFDAIAPSHHDLDVRDAEVVYKYISEVGPSIVINCTAYHDVDGCENNPRLAHLMNCEVPKSMAYTCNDIDATFIHFSTDYVFDGRKGSPYYEDDPVAPLNEYGRSKVCGEQAIMDVTDNYIIGRVSSLFGLKGSSNKGPNFIEKVLHAIDDLSIPDNIIMSPTYCRDATGALNLLVRNNFRGTFHLNNAGSCSWYEFACKIKELANLSIEIEPFESPNGQCNTSMASHIIYTPYWERALKDYINHDK